MGNSWQRRYEPDIWLPRSDWTNVHLGSSTTKNADSDVAHNLNAPLKDLYVELVISSTDGDNADANSFKATEMIDDTHRGYEILQVDNNNIKIQTGSGGMTYLSDAGSMTVLDNEDWFYKPKVWFVG
jgi:hypothetical protein